jgi:3'-phosphoadenosine 5'-phosphosulfate sulfotransferase (PAPS reductase)/FAD synthetase
MHTVTPHLVCEGAADAHAPAEIAAEIRRRDLPAHPLVAHGYPSIGCAPCTHPVAPGAPARSGRWLGFGKTECGIHRAQDRAREDRSQPQG